MSGSPGARARGQDHLVDRGKALEDRVALISGRLASRAAIVPRGVIRRLLSGRRRKPAHPRRILVAHQLLLGDTLMLTGLLSRLRDRHPDAEIVMTVSPQFAPLYATRPYGVRALPFDARESGAAKRLLEEPPFDLALIPGDNRYAMLALAIGSRWVTALEGDRPGWKNRLPDELVRLPAQPMALVDLFALLGGEDDGMTYRAGDWPAADAAPFDRPAGGYAVLHVGAGSPLRLWQAEKWRSVAAWLDRKGLQVVLSAGPGEEKIVAQVDPERRYAVFSGKLDIAQLRHLFEGARLLVCLDSGASHLAKIACTPTVALYGPGSAVLFGPGRFWRNNRYRGVTILDFPCRDQSTLFKREIEWVRRCQRTLAQCPAAACMHAIEVDTVLAECELLLSSSETARINR